jgi:hypothetical protein
MVSLQTMNANGSNGPGFGFAVFIVWIIYIIYNIIKDSKRPESEKVLRFYSIPRRPARPGDPFTRRLDFFIFLIICGLLAYGYILHPGTCK